MRCHYCDLINVTAILWYGTYTSRRDEHSYLFGFHERVNFVKMNVKLIGTFSLNIQRINVPESMKIICIVDGITSGSNKTLICSFLKMKMSQPDPHEAQSDTQL